LVLSLKENGLGTKEAGKVLGEMLKVNSVLKELDLSSNYVHPDSGGDAPGFAQELAAGIKDNRALTSLHVKQNGIPQREVREIIAIAMRMDSMKILCEVPFKDKTLTELDVSGMNLGMGGALVIAEHLDGNGALLVLDISNNSIGRRSRDGDGRAPWIATPEGPQAIAEALKSNVRDIMYMHITSANICHDKGAMTSLNLASNSLGVEGANIIAAVLPKCT
jgi:Ran GTPase-activating protein (RanGAP) involved in mRNA processing and transport